MGTGEFLPSSNKQGKKDKVRNLSFTWGVGAKILLTPG